MKFEFNKELLAKEITNLERTIASNENYMLVSQMSCDCYHCDGCTTVESQNAMYDEIIDGLKDMMYQIELYEKGGLGEHTLIMLEACCVNESLGLATVHGELMLELSGYDSCLSDWQWEQIWNLSQYADISLDFILEDETETECSKCANKDVCPFEDEAPCGIPF